MVKTYMEVQNEVLEIFTQCTNKKRDFFASQLNANIFSEDVGLSYIDAIYIFMRMEEVFSISIKDIDWERQDIFSVNGIVNFLVDYFNK